MSSRYLAISICVLAGCGSEPTPKVSEGGPSCHPKAGQPAPAVHGSVIQGDKIAIKPGHVTIVDFWATWCDPCKASFPAYQALSVKYKSAGLDVIAVNVDDDKSGIADFLKKTGKPTFTVGFDDAHETASCWGPDPMPTMFVVDKKGVVREVHRRWKDGDEKEIEKLIKTLL